MIQFVEQCLKDLFRLIRRDVQMLLRVFRPEALFVVLILLRICIMQEDFVRLAVKILAVIKWIYLCPDRLRLTRESREQCRLQVLDQILLMRSLL